MGDFAKHVAVSASASVAAGSLMFAFKEHLPAVEPLIHTIPITCAGVFFGSLYPDTDVKSHSSIICNGVLLVSCIVCGFVTKQFPILYLCLGMMIIPLLSKHRGRTHTIPVNLILSALIWFLIHPYLAVGYFVGFLGHLALDAI